MRHDVADRTRQDVCGRIAISQNETNIPRKSLEQKGHVNGRVVVRFAANKTLHMRVTLFALCGPCSSSNAHRHNDVVCSL